MTETNTATATEGIAIGRSGQICQRKDFGGKPFGVDVQLDGNQNYQAGVVSRAFKTEDAAQKFADKVNSGGFKGTEGFYASARNAIVVPVWPVPAKDEPYPWETPAGRKALTQAHGGKLLLPKPEAKGKAAPAA